MGLSETIDIPESGAVFTLGKSYLSENHQSYFFIKNDAIRRLICGRRQSAVVCESGRLFVWGENECGQLGVGSAAAGAAGADIVTKPSCVKTIKALGERVRHVAFGAAFTVILTETSKLFYSGRSTFEDEPAAIRERFTSVPATVRADGAADEDTTTTTTTNPSEPVEVLVCRKPFELTDFAGVLLDAEGNVDEHIVDVAAGDEHFVVLTGAGQIYGWGSNRSGQLGGLGTRGLPALLSDAAEPVRVVSCGRKCTAFITAANRVYVLGTCGPLTFATAASIDTGSIFEDLLYSIYASHDDDQIYLVISSGEIFRSRLDDEQQLHFQPHNVISENIRKICTGAGFVAIVTESNKLLTTFREKLSAESVNGEQSRSGGGHGRIRSPRELRKFQKLEVVDAVCGERHILVHGVHAAIAAGALLSSSSNDEADMASSTTATELEESLNDLNRAKDRETADGAGDSLIQTLRRCLTMKDSRNILASRIPVFDSRRLSDETMPEDLGPQDEEMATADKKVVPLEKSSSLDEFETHEREEQRSSNKRSQRNSGQSAMLVSPDSATSAGSSKSTARTVINRTPANHEDFNNNDDDVKPTLALRQQQRSRHSTEENDASLTDEQREVALQNEMLGIEDDDATSSNRSNAIMFIDNGVEMAPMAASPSTTVATVEGGDEDVTKVEDESSAELPVEEVGQNDTMELELLGERLPASKAVDTIDILTVQEATKIAVRRAVGEEDDEASDANGTPLKSSERTASIASEHASQTAEGGNVADGLVAVENGRVKRLMRRMQTRGRGLSCRNADAVRVEESDDGDAAGEIGGDSDGRRDADMAADTEKTSKVCTIL